MRRYKAWRYGCDHCKKTGGNGGHMKRHEAGCTMNPSRVCGVCREAGVQQPALSDLFAVLREPGTLEALREAADGCPACMLAAIRQSPNLLDSERWEIGFVYSDEKHAFWEALNAGRDESCR